MDKKAQTGSAISWFVATIVVVFILFLFLFFSFARTIVQRATIGKPDLSIGGSKLFEMSEQQRQMFVLFENEFERKTTYDLIRNLMLSEKKQYFPFDDYYSPNEKDPKREILEKSFSSFLESLKNQCHRYDLSHTEKTNDREITKYLFTYPPNILVYDPKSRGIFSFLLMEEIYLNRLKNNCEEVENDK